MGRGGVEAMRVEIRGEQPPAEFYVRQDRDDPDKDRKPDKKPEVKK